MIRCIVINWTICKSFTLHSRHNRASTSSLNVFNQMLFLMPNQQRQSIEDNCMLIRCFDFR